MRHLSAEENLIYYWTDRSERVFARLKSKAGHWTLEWGVRDPPASDNLVQSGEYVTSLRRDAAQRWLAVIQELSHEPVELGVWPELLYESALEDLQGAAGTRRKTLSLYLGTDPSTPQGRHVPDQLKQMSDSVLECYAQDPAAQKEFSQELASVEAYLNKLSHRPRTLALFSSRKDNFFRIYALPVHLENALYWTDTPILRPLLSATEEFQPTVVVLIDKEKARLFRLSLGRIYLVEKLDRPLPGRHKQGGWSQMAFQRHHDNHVDQHAAEVVDRLQALALREQLDRIVLAGPPEALAQLQHRLTPALWDLLVGTLPMEMFASPADVAAKVQHVLRQAHQKSGQELVSHLKEQVGFGRGLFGAIPVLEAINQQLVYILAYPKNLTLSGKHCIACGYLSAAPGAEFCPACLNRLEHDWDLLERALKKVHAQGGRVKELDGAAAEQIRRQGEIGALLRYPIRSVAFGSWGKTG